MVTTEPAADGAWLVTGESVDLTGRFLLAPSMGRVHYVPPIWSVDGYQWVFANQLVAFIVHGKSAIETRSAVEGRVRQVLIPDGQPVAEHQPLMWLDDDSSTGSVARLPSSPVRKEFVRGPGPPRTW